MCLTFTPLHLTLLDLGQGVKVMQVKMKVRAFQRHRHIVSTSCDVCHVMGSDPRDNLSRDQGFGGENANINL